jgi:hypothetical protein
MKLSLHSVLMRRPYVYDPEAKSSKFLIAIDSKSLASENLCPICLDPLNDQSQDPRKLQQCTHIYHKDCIGNWIANFNSDFGGVLIQGKLVIWDAGVFEANSGKDAYGIDGAKVLR